MSKMLTILIALLVLIGSFLAIRYAKDSYKLLTVNESNPLNNSVDNLHKNTGNFQNWKEFKQSDETFTALFPILPQHATDKVVDPTTKKIRKLDMYATADESGTGFIINKITLPSTVEKNEVDSTLRSAVNHFIERNKENKLKMTKSGKFQDLDSLDFALENKDVTVAGKVILHNNTLYMLSMADKTDNFSAEELNFFINSFHIINKSSIPEDKVEKNGKSESLLPSSADIKKTQEVQLPNKTEKTIPSQKE